MFWTVWQKWVGVNVMLGRYLSLRWGSHFAHMMVADHWPYQPSVEGVEHFNPECALL